MSRKAVAIGMSSPVAALPEVLVAIFGECTTLEVVCEPSVTLQTMTPVQLKELVAKYGENFPMLVILGDGDGLPDVYTFGITSDIYTFGRVGADHTVGVYKKELNNGWPQVRNRYTDSGLTFEQQLELDRVRTVV